MMAGGWNRFPHDTWRPFRVNVCTTRYRIFFLMAMGYAFLWLKLHQLFIRSGCCDDVSGPDMWHDESGRSDSTNC